LLGAYNYLVDTTIYRRVGFRKSFFARVLSITDGSLVLARLGFGRQRRSYPLGGVEGDPPCSVVF
jgi:hypothetical protein